MAADRSHELPLVTRSHAVRGLMNLINYYALGLTLA
jgi:hypothetical protein